MIVELLGAEAAHTQAKANRVLAMRDVALADAGLDFAIGRPIRASTGGPTEN